MIFIEISDHARQAMEDDEISEEEVKTCIDQGDLEIKQVTNGETRYGRKMEFMDKKIMVIYCIRQEIKRVITAYTIQRKKTWKKRD